MLGAGEGHASVAWLASAPEPPAAQPTFPFGNNPPPGIKNKKKRLLKKPQLRKGAKWGGNNLLIIGYQGANF